MMLRWLVIFGSTLLKNKAALTDILTDTIAIAIVITVIILGTKEKRKNTAQ
ncbi:hypothetical protein [Pedobacter hiemivivus]|uniref:hypothetical protein n=1 Tax=Pedobacter hiemivivus TaxID=2530454 RepID=UPI00146A1BF7|nr:hypothetical protein [Pedobacter hiemivivus]